MSIITLTSDWNNNDYYVAALKGHLLRRMPSATIVDITHKITTFSSAQAAFVVRHSFSYFADGTIHIIAVNTEPAPDRPLVAVKSMGHYFIGCDNGIFMLLLHENPFEAVVLQSSEKSTMMPDSIGTFADCACALSEGKQLNDLGTAYTNLRRQVTMLPTIDESVIIGSIVYIDSYKNAITNITRELFERIRNKRRFEIFVQSNHYKINKINKRYSETSAGELLAIFNSVGCLEIAINNGNAADLLNLSVGSSVRVKFYD
ncbi:MAG: SAM-dependent chlorinase/fluorinase [Bacteroidales bacterium]